MSVNKPIKPKRCKVCLEPFTPFRPLQVCCTSGCAIEYAQNQSAKQARKEYKVAKLKIKTRREWLKEVQAAFNSFIRERDASLGCISCGTKANVQYAAGHYRTIGSCPELRFNELNVNKQCNKHCNLELSGNPINYRQGLIAKYGENAVKWLEGKHEPVKYTIPELIEMKEYYRTQLRRLRSGLESPAIPKA